MVTRTDQHTTSPITKAFTFDALGRLTKVVDAQGTLDATTTLYKYDSLGNLIQVTDAENRVTVFQTDKLGRRTKRILPSAQSETITYSISANQLRKTLVDLNGRTIYFNYDKMDRLKSRAQSGVTLGVTNNYDALGRRVLMTDPSGSTEQDFDTLGGMIQKRRKQINGTSTFDMHTDYQNDPGGRLRSLNTGQDVPVGYNYDALNRLTEVANNYGYPIQMAAYSYDPAGNLKRVTTDPRVVSSQSDDYRLTHDYVYDNANRMTSVAIRRYQRDLVGTLTLLATHASFDYNPTARPLSPNGARRSVVETTSVTGSSLARTVNFDYDSLMRLTRETFVGGTPTGAVTYDAAVDYLDVTGFDRVGNRRSRSSTLSGVSPVSLTSFDINDRIDSDTTANTPSLNYDAAGNTKVEVLLVGAVSPSANPDQYDFDNKLVKRSDGTKTIDLFYDGDGNLVEKRITVGSSITGNIYNVDERNPTGYAQVLDKYEYTGSAGPTLQATYQYGLARISERTGSGSSAVARYYCLDGHGNVRMLAKAELTIVGLYTITDTYTYDAFGIPVDRQVWNGSTMSSVALPAGNEVLYLYAGESFHPDLGLYYLRARWYNPNSGRFWTMDTFEGDLNDPLSLHKYLYAHGNPVMMTDPSGQSSLGDVMSTIYVQTVNFAFRHPKTALVVGLAINLLVPEEVDQALIGSGIPGFQGLSAVRQGEVRFLKAVKNSVVNNYLTRSAAGFLHNRAGYAFEAFAKRVIFPSARSQIPTGNHIADYLWKGRLIELKTGTNLKGRELDQLAEFAGYAKSNSLTLLYMFLESPDPATVKKINDAGGVVVSFF